MHFRRKVMLISCPSYPQDIFLNTFFFFNLLLETPQVVLNDTTSSPGFVILSILTFCQSATASKLQTRPNVSKVGHGKGPAVWLQQRVHSPKPARKQTFVSALLPVQQGKTSTWSFHHSHCHWHATLKYNLLHNLFLWKYFLSICKSLHFDRSHASEKINTQA